MEPGTARWVKAFAGEFIYSWASASLPGFGDMMMQNWGLRTQESQDATITKYLLARENLGTNWAIWPTKVARSVWCNN